MLTRNARFDRAQLRKVIEESDRFLILSVMELQFFKSIVLLMPKETQERVSLF